MLNKKPTTPTPSQMRRRSSNLNESGQQPRCPNRFSPSPIKKQNSRTSSNHNTNKVQSKPFDVVANGG